MWTINRDCIGVYNPVSVNVETNPPQNKIMFEPHGGTRYIIQNSHNEANDEKRLKLMIQAQRTPYFFLMHDGKTARNEAMLYGGCELVCMVWLVRCLWKIIHTWHMYAHHIYAVGAYWKSTFVVVGWLLSGRVLVLVCRLRWKPYHTQAKQNKNYYKLELYAIYSNLAAWLCK